MAVAKLEDFASLESALRLRTNYELQRPPSVGWGLKGMNELVLALGHPERAQPVVHVAGTRGKGTTVAALASCLDAAGLRVGWTTSPHLVDLRERIRIGAAPAPDALWLEVAAHVLAVADRQDAAPTYFELVTAMAFEAFRRAEVDIALVEVGLGGRLDATNVVRPALCVISRIGLDHGHLLGGDEASVAAEKAGILKFGVPVVAGPEHPAAQKVIEARARELDADLLLLGRDAKLEVLEETRDLTRVRVETPWGRTEVETTLSGRTLSSVGLTALTLGCLQQRSLVSCSVDLLAASKPGLRRLRWRGRFDVVPGSPTIVIDGAHDAHAIEALVETFGRRFPGQMPVVLLGISRDKTTHDVLDLLTPLCAEAICTAYASPRAADPELLAAGFRSRGVQVTVPSDPTSVEISLALARNRARERGVPILVTGSLHLAGEVLALLGEDVSRAW